MSGDPATTRDVATKSEDFRNVATSAGVALKNRLHDDMELGLKTHGLISFEIKHYEDVLGDVKERFETQILQDRHPGGTLEWLKIFNTIKAVPYDNTAASSGTAPADKREDKWLLALYGGKRDDGKVGRSFSVGTRFDIEEGDIYLMYKIV